MTDKTPKVTETTSLNGTFSKRLKELREGKGLRQSDMAKLCGIAVPSYSNWEQGRALPPLAQIPVLARFFGVSADYLLGISKQDATERLVERMQSLPEKSQRIVLALIEDMLEKK